jgi:hypothetical protein
MAIDNSPSKRHVWKHVKWTERTGSVDHCQRCGRHFIEKADGRGPVHCFPTPAWTAANPTDDGKSR